MHVMSDAERETMVTAAIKRLAGVGCVMPAEEVEAALEAWGQALTDLPARLDDYVRRRSVGEPPAYILGGVPFLGHWVRVGPGAFIPRPWTEDVTRAAIDLLDEPGNLVDVGTGAGPIALAVARARRGATLWATELEPAALSWAHANLDGLENVTILQGDLFEPLPHALKERVNIVVGCLPYVPGTALDAMPRDFREHEPVGAFDGGPDGLAVVSRALEQATAWLRPGGWAIFEIGAGQGPQAAAAADACGYRLITIREDEDGDDAILLASP
jgi:release factor glutamine methyltransferase